MTTIQFISPGRAQVHDWITHVYADVFSRYVGQIFWFKPTTRRVTRSSSSSSFATRDVFPSLSFRVHSQTHIHKEFCPLKTLPFAFDCIGQAPLLRWGAWRRANSNLVPQYIRAFFFSLFPFECDAFFLPIGLWGHVGVSSMEVVVGALSSYSLDVQRNIAEAITDTFSSMCLWFAFKWEKSGLYSTRLEPFVEEWGRNRKFTQIERIK